MPARLLPLVHFFDARAPDFSLPPEELRRESRTARLLPGEGELPLDALLDALPPDVAVSVEAPRQPMRTCRGSSAPAATRDVLGRHRRAADRIK